MARALKAFSEGLGIVYVIGHGLSEDAIQRQYDLGSVFFDGVSDEEKHQYIAKIKEEGSWAGYKVCTSYGFACNLAEYPIAKRVL